MVVIPQIILPDPRHRVTSLSVRTEPSRTSVTLQLKQLSGGKDWDSKGSNVDRSYKYYLASGSVEARQAVYRGIVGQELTAQNCQVIECAWNYSSQKAAPKEKDPSKVKSKESKKEESKKEKSKETSDKLDEIINDLIQLKLSL